MNGRMGTYRELATLELPWEKLKGANVLITGANGLIASGLVDTMMTVNCIHELGINIYALCRNENKAKTRFSAYLTSECFHLLIQDVSEPLKTDVDFRYIVHAASSAHPQAFNTVPVDVMRANFLGTLNLLEYSLCCSSSRFMFVSSSEVYGENFEGTEIFSEETLGIIDYTRFRSCYPESKRASETLCMSFQKQFGSDVVVVRPAFIYGKDILDDNTRADVYFLRQVLNHKDIIMFSEGSQVRSYCYIKDCLSGMLYALLVGDCGGVYNIGNQDCVVTLREYAQTLATIGGVKLRYEPNTIPSGTVFLKTTKCILDTSRLEKLGWSPRYMLEDGIRDILAQVDQYHNE